MKKIIFLIAFISCISQMLNAQILYVDAAKGNDINSGAIKAPLATLQKAVLLARGFKGNEPVTIKIAPGLYELNTILKIETKDNSNNAAKYTLEATIMPEDTNWKPWLMPVIQSISVNNNRKYFDHCSGILTDRANVCIRGLKFLGNTNPNVEYYYPVEKDTTILNNLEISQCYFIGDRYGSVVQGAAYVEGPGIHIDHCIFYGCKNAVLSFENVKDFAITHSIIYGAYECAVWYGAISEKGQEEPFIFSDNIVSHCRYLWAATKGHDHAYYRFNHCLITENANYVGMQDGNGGVTELTVNEKYHENDIRKTGNVKLIEVETEGFPHDYLNLARGSDGKDIDAGIFKNH